MGLKPKLFLAPVFELTPMGNYPSSGCYNYCSYCYCYSCYCYDCSVPL